MNMTMHGLGYPSDPLAEQWQVFNHEDQNFHPSPQCCNVMVMVMVFFMVMVMVMVMINDH